MITIKETLVYDENKPINEQPEVLVWVQQSLSESSNKETDEHGRPISYETNVDDYLIRVDVNYLHPFGHPCAWEIADELITIQKL